MNIGAILKKIAEGKELTDAEKEFAKSYVEPKNNEAELSRVKTELETMKQSAAELQKKMDEAENAKLTDVEKLTKQVNELTKQVETVTRDRDSLKIEKDGLVFNSAVEKLARDHHFTDVDFLKFKLSAAKLDLSKSDKTAEFMAQLKKDSPKFFEADVNVGGAGSPGGAPGAQKSAPDAKTRYDEIMKKENPTAVELAEAMELSTQIKAESVDGQQNDNN